MATIGAHNGARSCGPAPAFACVLAIALPLVLAFALLPHGACAYAEDIDTNPEADEFQQEVERTASIYEEAVAKVDAANKALEENRARADELEKEIPVQQERSDAAARELYKVEQQSGGIIELLLNSSDFHSFLTNLEYAVRASQANVAEINKLAAMKSELDQTQANLKQAKADADQHAEEAKSALEAAKEARQEAQRRAQEEARRQAEAEAAAAAAAAQAAAQEQETEKSEEAKKADEEKKSDASEKPKEEKKPDQEKSSDSGEAEKAEAAPAELNPPSDDGANWTSDQAAFINEWAARIDAYLAGSPLGGQGKTFAAAAWEYGVDPRWSPAISFTESSKGADCFHPYNAWGWGAVSWGSWEEAINAHVRGLARGYGYTISVEAAQKYCPPNWEKWYERTSEQMNLI